MCCTTITDDKLKDADDRLKCIFGKRRQIHTIQSLFKCLNSVIVFKVSHTCSELLTSAVRQAFMFDTRDGDVYCVQHYQVLSNAT